MHLNITASSHHWSATLASKRAVELLCFHLLVENYFSLGEVSQYSFTSLHIKETETVSTGELRNSLQSLQTSLVSCFRIYIFLFLHLFAF